MSYSRIPFGRVTLRPLAAPAAAPLPTARSQSTLAQWLERWMESEIEPRRADTTIGGYRNIIQRHLIPALGAVELSALPPERINGYYRWLSAERSLSPNTIHKHHVLLNTALNWACRQGALPANPVQRAAPPRTTSTDAVYYTPARLDRLLREVANCPLELPIKLACFLGLRRGELLGLRWRDVELHSGLVSVRRTRTAVGYRVVEKPPKTDDSARTLSIVSLDDLLSFLRSLLQSRQRTGIPCGPDDYLVLDAAGHPWHPNALSAALADFVSQRRLPPITFHGLRHTFATVANSVRVPMYQISRAMGHSSPSVTQRIYTHLFDQTHGEVLAAVAQAIVEAGPASL